ncbi:MAG: hypothetical protein QOD80_1717 [Verrucomicrobiota bacterium]
MLPSLVPGVGVGVGVGVDVAVAVGVDVAVAVGVGLAVAEGVGLGVGVPWPSALRGLAEKTAQAIRKAIVKKLTRVRGGNIQPDIRLCSRASKA